VNFSEPGQLRSESKISRGSIFGVCCTGGDGWLINVSLKRSRRRWVGVGELKDRRWVGLEEEGKMGKMSP